MITDRNFNITIREGVHIPYYNSAENKFENIVVSKRPLTEK